mmetsp:Transcript_46781/g.99999  ORF Transcript_46781/g.99999 Transcript_46781/m.99999 type:complete len:222 (-) Transcript_46781:235-900(-)
MPRTPPSTMPICVAIRCRQRLRSTMTLARHVIVAMILASLVALVDTNTLLLTVEGHSHERLTKGSDEATGPEGDGCLTQVRSLRVRTVSLHVEVGDHVLGTDHRRVADVRGRFSVGAEESARLESRIADGVDQLLRLVDHTLPSVADVCQQADEDNNDHEELAHHNLHHKGEPSEYSPPAQRRGGGQEVEGRMLLQVNTVEHRQADKQGTDSIHENDDTEI